MQTDFFRTHYAEGGSVGDTGNIGGGSNEAAMPYKQLDAPVGNFYTLGNSQILQATGKARTFIGGETTYGTLMNLGGSNSISTDTLNGRKYNPSGRIVDYDWWSQAQRWHFKVGLPSSTIFVEHDKVDSFDPDRSIDTYVGSDGKVYEYKEVRNMRLKEESDLKADYVILCTADIQVVGDTYALKYSHENDNGTIKIRKTDGSWTNEKPLPTNIPPVLAIYSAGLTTEYDISIRRTH